MAADNESRSSPVLSYESHNPNAPESILLIHGGFSNRTEWDSVRPLLESHGYHILIPDLPMHGESVNIQPFLLDDTARRLAHLICSKTHNGSAHVVANSIGAHVAAALASEYSDRVSSLAVSGFNLFTPSWFSPALPPLLYLFQTIAGLIQDPAAKFSQAWNGHGSLSLTRDVLNTLISDRELGPIRCRTLVIAATKESFLPKDRIEDARRLFRAGVPGNGSRAVQHRGIRHAWVVEQPSVFATMVECWIRGESLPDGFEDL